MRSTVFILLLSFFTWAHSAVKPADGFWRSTDDPDIGSGFMLLTQGDVTLVSVYSYTSNGQPKWYLAVGQVDENGVFLAELRENINGSYILSENPQSATFSTDVRQLEIHFEGSETGRFTIDGSDSKAIQPLTFGHDFWFTEHHNLSDGTFYQVPDPSGHWAVGRAQGTESFILSLAEVTDTSEVVITNRTYLSHHDSSDGWMLQCPYQFIPNTLPISQPYCVLDRSVDELEPLKLAFNSMGNESITMNAAGDDNLYFGKRINYGQSLKPSDGHWRAEDDPDIGSGLVMTTQGEVTVVMLYSYDDQGRATWEIANGVFDENGLLQTVLNTAVGGSPIEDNGKTTASFTATTQSLEIQLLGTELATFSINGSAPKHIQTINFGVPSLKTANFQVGGKDYQFSAPQGRWLFYQKGNPAGNAFNLDLQQEDAVLGFDAQSFLGQFDLQPFYLRPYGFRFSCDLFFNNQSLNYCAGTYLGGDYTQSLYVKYANIGVNRIALTLGQDPGDEADQPKLGLIRLD